MFKKIALGLTVLALMLVSVSVVFSDTPFVQCGDWRWRKDPCDCCFDDVDIEIGDFVYDGNYQNAYWELEITPTRNGRPIDKTIAFDAYIWSSQYGYIYGHDAFYLDESVFDNVYYSGIRPYDDQPAIYKVVWQPGLDYEFKIHGFNYEDTIHLMIVLPSGCVLQSPPMVFDFGSPPVPVGNK